MHFFPKVTLSTKKKQVAKKKNTRRLSILLISKRQKFILSVGILSLCLFISEYFFSNYAIVMPFLLGIVTDILLAGALFEDLTQNISFYPFLLPFLCSLSFGLFFFLAPARLLTRLVLTSLYAIGLYSLFLSENIFVVASIRTIALLSSARIITFIITLISYFFLSNTIFSLRFGIIPTTLLFTLSTFLFTYHALWTYTLESSPFVHLDWVGVLTLCLSEIAIILWFWPTSPTVFALFLTSIFYVLIGLVHVWFDKRLFKNVLWEYVWVGVVASFIFLAFTRWQ